MKNLPLYLWTVVLLCAGYALINLFFYLRFKILLRNANLVTFKKILGGNYQFRTQANGLIKYKWRVMFMIIKGNFDSQGRLRDWKIKLARFFPPVQGGFSS